MPDNDFAKIIFLRDNGNLTVGLKESKISLSGFPDIIKFISTEIPHPFENIDRKNYFPGDSFITFTFRAEAFEQNKQALAEGKNGEKYRSTLRQIDEKFITDFTNSTPYLKGDNCKIWNNIFNAVLKNELDYTNHSYTYKLIRIELDKAAIMPTTELENSIKESIERIAKVAASDETPDVPHDEVEKVKGKVNESSLGY
jgi:hypothetical protein